MRQYQPVWLALKSSGKVEIAVPPTLQARVIKAVRLERYKDTSFNLANRKENKVVILKIHKSTNKVSFELTHSLYVGDL